VRIRKWPKRVSELVCGCRTGWSARAPRSWLALLVLAPAFLAPTSALSLPCHRAAHVAEPTSEQLRQEAETLRGFPYALRSNYVPAGETQRFGRGEVLVEAPADDVLRQVRSFANYKDLAPRKFRQSRVVDREGEFTDVYMQVPLIGGMIVLWQIMRFGPSIQLDLVTTVVDGRFVRGNIQTSRVVFTVRRVSPTLSILACDLLIALDLPAPEEKIDEELRDAASDAVLGIRDKAQAQYRARTAAQTVAPSAVAAPALSTRPPASAPAAAPATTAAPLSH
jgi:hypothetical protein